MTQTAEQATPAARSDYSIAATMKDAQAWVAADPIKRKIGTPAATGSMLRVFDSKSILLLEKIGPTDVLNLGDIIGYSNPDLVSTDISHRFIRIDPNGMLVFKGDSNSSEDPPVVRKAVQWRIVGILYTSGN